MKKVKRPPITPHPDMEDPIITDAELERIKREIDEHDFGELPAEDQPLWLFLMEVYHGIREHVESVTGRYVSEGMDNAYSELVEGLILARQAFTEEAVGSMSEALIRKYLEDLEVRWIEASEKTEAVRASHTKREDRGIKTGYAAQSREKYWVTYWDDRWLERRQNGKGWVYSTEQIIKSLPTHAVPPKHSTVSRYRTKLAKEQKQD